MKYDVYYDQVIISLRVTVEADDETDAAEMSWDKANEYMQTVYGNNRDVSVDHGGLDGIGADRVEERRTK